VSLQSHIIFVISPPKVAIVTISCMSLFLELTILLNRTTMLSLSRNRDALFHLVAYVAVNKMRCMWQWTRWDRLFHCYQILIIFPLLCLTSAGDFCSKILIQPLLLLIMRGNKELRYCGALFTVDWHIWDFHKKRRKKKAYFMSLRKEIHESLQLILILYSLLQAKFIGLDVHSCMCLKHL
jgi:hypothetical protein